MEQSKHIVIGITGSIAAYKSCDVIRKLLERGHKVSVVMTKDAEHFITPLTLSSLSGSEVYRDMFEKGSEDWTMPHIRLAEEADVVAVVPATASIIASLAHGFAGNLISCLILGTKAKVCIAPAMNTEMYINPLVQGNCEKLKKCGYTFIEPKEGKLACGTKGTGHIADLEDIVQKIEESLK